MSERPGYNPEEKGYKPDFVLSRELLNELDIEDDSRTQKLGHVDFPELYVRRYQGNSELNRTIEDIREDYNSYHKLQDFGVEVLPFSVVEHAGEIKIITQRVKGIPLTDAIKKAPEKVLPECDHVIAGTIKYLKNVQSTGEKYPMDVVGLGQYMYGQYQGGEERDRILLVDIDPYEDSFNDGGEVLTQSILANIGEDILEAEGLAGREKLRVSRELYELELGARLEKDKGTGREETTREIIETFERGDHQGMKEMFDAR